MPMVDDTKRFYWLRLNENFFDEDSIAWLREQENGDAYALFYLQLCLKAINSEGILIRRVGKILVPYNQKKLAEITQTKFDTVKAALEKLNQIGLVEFLQDGSLYLPQVTSMIGSESLGAKRKREQRAKKIASISEGGTLSLCCPTEIEKEIEKEIDKEIEKEIEKEIDIPPAEESSANKKAKVVRHKHGEYDNVLLSDEELEKLKSEFPNDWQERIERVSEYVASTGKSYKNFLAVIRSWARKDGANGKIQRCMVGSSQGKVRRRYEYESDEKRQELLDAWV